MQILVLEAGHLARYRYIEEGCELLRPLGPITLIRQEKQDQGEVVVEKFLNLLPDADTVVISPWFRPSTLPDQWLRAKNMKILAGTFDFRFSDWIDFEQMLARGVTLIDTSRSMTPSVAEFALAMTLNLIRDIPATIDIVRKGDWKPKPWDNRNFIHGDLTGRNVGLAGFGSIHRRYAELLTPFKCTIRVYDPYVPDQVISSFGAQRVDSLNELAQTSEIFSVGIPPTPATLNIISKAVINALPMGSLFLLTTRMAVVEQEALWHRIRSGEIMAAIDVFEPEPPPKEAWFRLASNVLPTPHLAGDTDFCHRRCFTEACKDVVAIHSGSEPRYKVQTWDHRVYEGKPEAQSS